MVVFFGNPRSDLARTGTESPPVMTGPFIVLALLCVNRWLVSVRPKLSSSFRTKRKRSHCSRAGADRIDFGAGIAISLYRNRERDPMHLDLIRRRFYIDEFYQWIIGRDPGISRPRSPHCSIAGSLTARAVRGASGATFGFGSLLRLFQVGNLQAYAFLFGLGIVALIYFTVLR